MLKKESEIVQSRRSFRSKANCPGPPFQCRDTLGGGVKPWYWILDQGMEGRGLRWGVVGIRSLSPFVAYSFTWGGGGGGRCFLGIAVPLLHELGSQCIIVIGQPPKTKGQTGRKTLFRTLGMREVNNPRLFVHRTERKYFDLNIASSLA